MGNQLFDISTVCSKVVSTRVEVVTKSHMISHLEDPNDIEMVKLRILQYTAMKVDWTMNAKPTEVKRALAVKKKTASKTSRCTDQTLECALTSVFEGSVLAVHDFPPECIFLWPVYHNVSWYCQYHHGLSLIPSSLLSVVGGSLLSRSVVCMGSALSRATVAENKAAAGFAVSAQAHSTTVHNHNCIVIPCGLQSREITRLIGLVGYRLLIGPQGPGDVQCWWEDPTCRLRHWQNTA